MDAAGRIYVADTGNSRIVRMNDMTGTGWTELGTVGSVVKEFSMPSGIFVDMAGRIYVTDSGNNRIVRMDDLSGAGWVTLGHRGSGTNEFDIPWTIFVR